MARRRLVFLSGCVSLFFQKLFSLVALRTHVSVALSDNKLFVLSLGLFRGFFIEFFRTEFSTPLIDGVAYDSLAKFDVKTWPITLSC